jgi:hypothetical protein
VERDVGVGDVERRVSERVVIGAVLLALVLGIALYNVVPLDGSSGAAPAAAHLPSTDVSGAPTDTGSVAAGTYDVGSSGLGGGGLFDAGSVGALLDGGTAGAGAGTTTVDLPGTPTPPDVPAPTCPTSVASDAYEQVVDPISAASGRALPRDNVRLLAEIAAGCSNESATTPVIGLALDLARLLPDSGLEPVDLSAVPYVEAPALPPAVIDALGPIADPIRDGCANVSLLGILVAVVPGAAHIPVRGSDLGRALAPAESLCAQFER